MLPTTTIRLPDERVVSLLLFIRRPFPRAELREPHAASPSGQADPSRFYNYARTRPRLSHQLRESSGRDSGKGRNRSRLGELPVSHKEAHAYPSCDSEMGTADLVLRILPRHMAAKLHHPNEPLGFAQICSETEPACELNVLYHQIEELGTHGYRADPIRATPSLTRSPTFLSAPLTPKKESCALNDLHRFQRISWGLTLELHKNQSRRLPEAVLETTRSPAQQVLTQENLMARRSPLARIFSAPPRSHRNRCLSTQLHKNTEGTHPRFVRADSCG